MKRFIAAHLLLLITRYSNAQSTSSLTVSDDGNCGASFGQTCLGSRFGDCCSGKGFCGSTSDYCAADCQNNFGSCSSANSTLISSNGDCGATDAEGQICLGSTFGNCCSEKGFCGSTSDYCGTGCQSGYGNCGSNEGDGDNTSSTSPSATAPPAVTSSSSTAPGVLTTVTQGAISTQSGSEDSADETNMSSGAVAGVAVGAVGGAAILAGAVFFFLRRRRQQKHSSDELDAPALPPKSAGDRSLSDTYTPPLSVATTVATTDHGPEVVPKEPVEISPTGDERVELSAEKDLEHTTTVYELPSQRWSKG